MGSVWAGVVGLAVGFLSALAAAAAAETLEGPIPAEVVRVVDGDTLAVRAHIWLGQNVEIAVRIDGVDAPEMRGACTEERRLARAAQSFLAARVEGRPVILRHVRNGKYAGRVVARVETWEGEDLAGLLLGAGLARAYGGRQRAAWCT